MVEYQWYWLGTAGTVRNLRHTLTKVTIFQTSCTNQKPKMMKNTLLNPELTIVLQEASAVIKNNIRTGGIYCFATRRERISHTTVFNEPKETGTAKTHVYLLVLTEETKTNATADVSDLIAGLIPDCKATLLLHKNTSLRQLTSHQKWFFDHVMKEGLLVWEHPDFPPYLHLDTEPVRNPALSGSYWHQRLRIARTYLESEQQIEASGMECVQHSMLHVVVEQVCLGMIAVFLGYQPTHYSLGYLFDLCSLFTPLTNELFPRQTEEDRQLYALLTTNFGTLRHAKTHYHGFTNTELLSKRCGIFVEQAELLVTKELERLETITPNN